MSRAASRLLKKIGDVQILEFDIKAMSGAEPVDAGRESLVTLDAVRDLLDAMYEWRRAMAETEARSSVPADSARGGTGY